VTRIRINRPEVRNACRPETLAELNAALQEAGCDSATKVITIAGTGGKAFCAGADLRAMARLKGAQSIENAMRGWWALLENLRALQKPIIAAVQGFAVGGGTEVTLACHIVVAAKSAKFGLPEIKLGHIPGAGGTALLPRRIGFGPAAYYLLTGETIPADRAETLGLVAKVVPDEELESTVAELADRLAGFSAEAVRAIIATLTRGADMTTDEAIKFERQVSASLRGTADFHEGLDAFIEKRTPSYGLARKKT
jgi:enoyl-CoA hydratase/carnithine racemase